MKFKVMMGAVRGSSCPYYVGKYKYENMNFGLCDLIAIINGNVTRT